MDFTIPIAIPSRNRAIVGTTWNLFPEAKIFIHESEVEEYTKAGLKRRLITHKIENCNVSKIYNYILDYYGDDRLIIMDDDVKEFYRFRLAENEKCYYKKITIEEIKNYFIKGFQILRDKKGIFGFNISSNLIVAGKCLKRNRLISQNVLIGQIWGHNKPDLRFDEDLSDKCDYDYVLQNYIKGNLIFRFNEIWYNYDYGNLKGGAEDYRRDKNWKKEVALKMLKKWGNLVRINPKRKYEILLNIKSS